MYVQELVLQNIRNFRDLKIEFSKGVNIITGVNNSGKSTIIKALYKLQNLYSLTTDDIRIEQNKGKMLVKLNEINDQDRDSFSNSKHTLKMASTEVWVSAVMNRNSAPDNKFIEQQQGGSYVPVTIDILDTLRSADVFLGDFFGLPSSEESINFIYPFFARRKTDLFTVQKGKAGILAVQDNFQNLALKVSKVSQNYATKPQFEELCNDLLGFTIATTQGENNEMRLCVYAGNNQTIPIESMGEGVINIVGLITMLLTENGKLFLIEELENDIHPLPLKKLLALIIEKSKDNQFIISTHSNIVLKYLGSIPEAKIFCTHFSQGNRASKNVSTSSVEIVGKSIGERKEVLELLGYDFFDFEMYSAYIIFEESSTERIIRDFLLPTFFPKAHLKVRTIAAQGVDDVLPKFNDLNRLFMFLHISGIYKDRAWVMVDGDTAGQRAVKELQKKFSTAWSDDHFIQFKQPCFEKYYPKKFQKEVEALDKMQTGQQKQQVKTALLNQVLAWIAEDKERAKKHFGKSCKDIIEHLQKVEEKIA